VRYEIEVGGRTRQVVVTRVGGGFAVTVDRRTWQVDAARIDARTLSLIVDSDPEKGTVPLFQEASPASKRRVSSDVSIVADSSTGQLTVHVGATPVVVTVNGRRRWGRKEESAGAGSGPQRVTAPMPGKIVRLLVKAGDAVSARQALVVVEAMKMENELRAGRAGTIAEIHVREGASVEAGALLIVIQ
jgi:biotin carboxyl carrier protein